VPNLDGTASPSSLLKSAGATLSDANPRGV